MRGIVCGLMAALLLWPVSGGAQVLPSWLELSARLERAHVPACPRERAQGFELHWRDGGISGRLARLSLDLTCSRSGNQGTEGERDALSLLLTLPPVDFAIERLVLYLPQGELTGPARLRRDEAGMFIDWQTGGGELTLLLTPRDGGWRWRGTLPGSLLLPALTGLVAMEGEWKPGQDLQLNASTALPAPFAGQLRLRGRLAQGEQGWYWQPASRLSLSKLSWPQGRLRDLSLRPTRALPLTGVGHWTLSWRDGRWQQQGLPGGRLELSLTDHQQGELTLRLNPQVKVSGYWRRQGGLALQLPEQSLPLAAVTGWLQGWLNLPVATVSGGELTLSGRAGNLLDATRPVTLDLALSDGDLGLGEVRAQGVTGQLGLGWRRQGLVLSPGSGLTIGELNTGVPVTNIHAALDWRNNAFWLAGLTGRVLDGRLALSPMKLGAHSRGELHLQDISLAQLLSLAALPGLTGDGDLHGRLPFVFDGRFSVENGRLWGDDGWVSYQAADTLLGAAEDNLSLALTLGMLKDLRYHRLEAELAMTPKGDAVIVSRLRGQAPVGERLHPVNFNYRHEENLLQLLTSLRFAEQLSERLPAGLQGGSNE
ncbi:YdbH domain-containing protein [Oceanimonas sp. MB9]|uniref:intermembrane phospholipid transport protein YdbH family protein n=1 Tax=Oceanimonas sp. MB9 TaxID=2588453 RepID=UPI001981A7B3|nr:YdbH domain-containing protein [Oceanimonas sp. MB9]NHH99363.1 hypothetical protein [Oceanimonas sp. MB9]